MARRMAGRVEYAHFAHPVTVLERPDGSATQRRDRGCVLSASPDICSGRELGRLGQTANVVEMAVREHDVGDVCPRRTYDCQGPADRRAASGSPGIDEYHTARIDDDETADLEGHRIGSEHSRWNLYLRDHWLDDRYSHPPRIEEKPFGDGTVKGRCQYDVLASVEGGPYEPLCRLLSGGHAVASELGFGSLGQWRRGRCRECLPPGRSGLDWPRGRCEWGPPVEGPHSLIERDP